MRAVNKRALESLIKCGAFDSIGTERNQLLASLDAAMQDAARRQRDVLSGQGGLFGEETMEEVQQIAVSADVPPSTARERLTWEKEATGFYITGHPLDDYSDTLSALLSIGEIPNTVRKDRQLVRIGGILTSTKRFTTKKGDTMLFAELEDFSGKIEVTVFPRVFYAHVSALEPDAIIVVEGRVDTTGEEPKLLAEEIWGMNEYRSSFYLIPQTNVDRRTLWTAMQEIFAAHPGDHPVYVQSEGRWRRLGETYWIDGSKEAQSALTRLMGESAVKMR